MYELSKNEDTLRF